MTNEPNSTAGNTVDPDAAWYFCLRHHTVEQGPGCRALDRLGPYPTREAATHALESAARRTTEEDRRDRTWEDGDQSGTGSS